MPAQRTTARSLLGAGLGLFGFSAIAGLLVAVMVAPAIAVTGITATNSTTVFQEMPDYIEIAQQQQRNTFVALGAKGNEIKIADVFNQNREEVSLDSIDEDLKWAAIDGEDRRFYEHGGVDLPSLVRAAIGQLSGESDSGGASTLSMQLVRNILVLRAVNTPISDEFTQDDYDAAIRAATYPDLNRKLKEMKLAIGLEKKYTKDEILQGYLNIVLMGGTTYGVEAGAQRYFGTSAADVTPAQAASLIAIVQNPSRNGLNNPENFERNKERRDLILWWMHEQGHLTDEQYTEAKETPVDDTTVSQNTPRSGCTSAPVEYRYPCDFALKTILNGEVPSLGATKEEQLARWKEGGLTVVLSIDPWLQKTATDVAKQYAPANVTSMQLGAAVTSVQVGTGRILIMAQNKTFDDTGDGDKLTTTAVNFSADEAHGASKGYQPGSTYKPFTLLTFLAAGHGINETFNASILSMPMSSFQDSCNGPWTGPDYTYKNDSGERGLYTAARGTAASVNSVFTQMAAELDQCDIREMARSFGMHRADGAADGSDIATRPACSLGGCENNFVPMTTAAAYAGIANQGTFCKAIIIDQITAVDGTELGGQEQECNPTLASPAVANTAAYAMGMVMTSGTGSASNPNDGTPYIGKTGTANKAQNTWMSGSSTEVSTTVWVGNIVGDQSLRAISINGNYGGSLRHYIFKPIALAIDSKYPGHAFPGADSSLLSGTPVIVPDNLVGMTAEQAKAAIELAKLSYVDAGSVDSDEPAGTVVKTEPGSGASVPKGSGVKVYVSNGLAVALPDVSNMGYDYEGAKSALRSQGFANFSQACEVADPDADPGSIGTVVAQDPAAGTMMNPKKKVTLTVRQLSCDGP
ncbi:transglycosylase domain-containing protein [Homoserinibacter sp. GY 40078]|uniref:transglycosylase domain-containing protein n=1 Tax=Homoserinibacter sp. GY 40078 TaxID=2603275 RepID=UPI0011C8CD15|nr:transglycosylase domain-containing protein [Homoserinibacter sp. GY 40078]TXK18462.1 PASTA domain-containing protein [Homoserinibacter sp. GY 40078]